MPSVRKIDATPLARYGADAPRWLLAAVPPAAPRPASLLDGYTASAIAPSDARSYAGFAQVTWNVTDRLHFTRGLRYTYEETSGSFNQTVSGGLPTLAGSSNDNAKLSIARPQSYAARFGDDSLSGQANVCYDVTSKTMAYTTFSKGHKSGGIDLAGISVDANGNAVVTTAVIKPENVTSYEIGVKNELFDNSLTLNVAGVRHGGDE
jgi:iron complex outermembrane receptor protein